MSQELFIRCRGAKQADGVIDLASEAEQFIRATTVGIIPHNARRNLAVTHCQCDNDVEFVIDGLQMSIVNMLRKKSSRPTAIAILRQAIEWSRLKFDEFGFRVVGSHEQPEGVTPERNADSISKAFEQLQFNHSEILWIRIQNDRS